MLNCNEEKRCLKHQLLDSIEHPYRRVDKNHQKIKINFYIKSNILGREKSIRT